jgi:hypothetical protein
LLLPCWRSVFLLVVKKPPRRLMLLKRPCPRLPIRLPRLPIRLLCLSIRLLCLSIRPLRLPIRLLRLSLRKKIVGKGILLGCRGSIKKQGFGSAFLLCANQNKITSGF